MPQTDAATVPTPEATPATLRRPRPARSAEKTSRFRGVTLFASQQKYQAFVKIAGVRTHLGMWRDEVEAAIARDRYLLFLGQDPSELQVASTSVLLGAADAAELHRLARLREHERCSSRYLGVAWNAQRALWDVKVPVARSKYRLIGKFADERDAAIAYDRYMLHHAGPHAPRNFPELALEPLSADDVRRLARAKHKQTTTSRFRGVSWSTKEACWRVQLHVGERKWNLGPFGDEGAAARAYDEIALQILGREARLNFDPRTGEERADACTLPPPGPDESCIERG